MLAWVSRLGPDLLGAVFIWCGLFLYESEAGQIENRLDDLWRDVEARRQRTISAYGAFMRTVAAKTDRLLTGVFGRKLISLRFTIISACATIATVNLVLLYRNPDDLERLGAAAIATGVIFFASDRLGDRLWPAALFLTATVSAFAYEWAWWETGERGPIMQILPVLTLFTFGEFRVRLLSSIIVIVSLSLACNVVVIALARRLIRLVDSVETLTGLTRLLVTTALVTAISVMVPICAPVLVARYSADAGRPMAVVDLAYVGYANIYSTSAFVLFFALSVVMLLHRVVWNSVQRPLYAAGRKFHLFRQNKTLMTVGVSLIGLRHPPVADAIRVFASKLGL
jgi:hypothetical protein